MAGRRPRVTTYYRTREGYWTVRWREHGRQREIGGIETQDEAEDEAHRIRERLRHGLSGVRPARNVSDVVANWYDVYVHSESVMPATRQGYRRDARRILDTIGDESAYLSTSSIRVWRDQLARDYSPRVANKAHTALSSAYERALEHDPPLVEANPCRGLSKLPETLQPIDMPTRQQVEYLEQTAPAPRELAMLMIASRGGLRQSELLGLRVGAVSHNAVYVSTVADLGRQIRESTKTKRSQRRVPLPPRTIKAVRAIIPTGAKAKDLLFPSPQDAARPLQRTSWSRFHWTRWKLAAAWLAASEGEPEDVWGRMITLEWKNLRHHAVSRWAAGGGTITQVSRWSGDSISTLDKHYAHLFDEDEADVMAAVD